MKKIFLFIVFGLIFTLALVNSSKTKVFAGYHGGQGCSSHVVCSAWCTGHPGCPFDDPYCDRSCWTETRCCDSCGQQDPGIVFCMVRNRTGEGGVCEYSCGSGPTPTSPPGTPTPPPPPCSVSGPTNPSVTNITAGSATLNWTPGSRGTQQLIRVGPDRVEVESGCPGGVGAPPLCAVATSIATGVSSYNASGLEPNTSYYWRAVEYDPLADWMDFNGICNNAYSEWFITSVVECVGYEVNPLPLSGTGDIDFNPPVTVGAITAPYDIDPLLGILFTIDPLPGVAQFTGNPLYPNPDTTALYQVEMEALAIGSTTYTATATLNDPGATQCSDTANITVNNPGGWWQVVGGDVATNGNIKSVIPSSCVAPGCEPVLITGDPGVPSYLSSITPVAGLPPNISSTDWNAGGSTFSPTQPYDYAFFEERLPDGRFEITVPTISQAMLNLVAAGAVGSEIDGYYWYYYDGSTYGGVLTLDGTLDLTGTDRKIVLFVENADLKINGRILVQKGQSSVLVIVDENILVDPLVGGGVGPHLEGLYITDGNFNTGTTGAAIPDDIQLHVRGSVATPFGTVNFQRNLADNSLTPGELFEYGPDQTIFFPPGLAGKRTIWREVAP